MVTSTPSQKLPRNWPQPLHERMNTRTTSPSSPALSPAIANTLPTLLVPGLACSPALFAPQLPTLWRHGPVTLAQTTEHDSMAEMARAILHDAPPRFVLMGLSMGGYIAFEILRQAPERVAALAILDSSARADSEEARALRLRVMELARQDKLPLAIELNFPRSVHASRADDEALRAAVQAMAQDTGVAAYLRQQTAIMQRCDSRPSLAHIRCPSLVLVGAEDQLTPPALAEEIHAALLAGDQARGASGSAAAAPLRQLHIVPQCGHLSTLEQPALVAGILDRWLLALRSQG